MPSPLLVSIFYAIYLGSLGAIVPFLGGHLHALGLSGAGLGVIFAISPLGRLIVAPPAAALADRYRVGGWLLRLGTLVSVVGALGLCLATSAPAAGLFLGLFFIGRATPSPALDALTLEALRAAGRPASAYGRVRLWGSIGFMVAVWCAARLSAPLVLGAGLTALSALMAWALPARAGPPPVPVLPALRRLAGDPFLGPFLLTVGVQGLTHSVYDAFFSVHVHALGFGDDVTARAVLLGVSCEVAVMAAGARLLTRFRAIDVLGAAVILAIPRWLLTASVRDPALLVAVQALHGVSFGAFWIAGVHVMSTRAPRAIATASQSLFVAASYGVGALVGSLLAGTLDEIAGTSAIFYGMAACSTIGALFWILTRSRWGTTEDQSA